MIQYLEILQEVLDKGTWKRPARDNMPRTISRFGITKRFDLSKGFPLVTTKKMFFNGALHELLWFLRGDTNIHYLVKNGVNIWNEDGYKWYKKRLKNVGAEDMTLEFPDWVKAVKGIEQPCGDLGKIYSHQWRSFGSKDGRGWVGGVDQITRVVEGIKANPESRYNVVSAWNPAELNEGALPPCHMLFMFNCREIFTEQRYDMAMKSEELRNELKSTGLTSEWLTKKGIPTHYLDCDMTQRSCDTPLGVPFNIASYALLTMIIAKLTNTVPGEFIWSGKDVHIYENQIDAVYNQLERTPLPLPTMEITSDWDSIEDIKFEDFKLRDYKSHDSIKYPLSTGLILR